MVVGFCVEILPNVIGLHLIQKTMIVYFLKHVHPLMMILNSLLVKLNVITLPNIVSIFYIITFSALIFKFTGSLRTGEFGMKTGDLNLLLVVYIRN